MANYIITISGSFDDSGNPDIIHDQLEIIGTLVFEHEINPKQLREFLNNSSVRFETVKEPEKLIDDGGTN